MALTLALAMAGPAAHAQGRAGPELEIASCVNGSPPLRAAGNAERALLDGGDRARFQGAALVRYPLYERGGLVPQQVVLLRREGRWVYVTLQERRHGGPCFAAVFAAERFDFTEGWLRKYRPQAGPSDD
jgi:hypothetical protein